MGIATQRQDFVRKLFAFGTVSEVKIPKQHALRDDSTAQRLRVAEHHRELALLFTAFLWVRDPMTPNRDPRRVWEDLRT